MIDFFRKIRQRMLNDNRFGKYLIYAIGEIVLVVIGILIALQINTWNQGRLDRQTEINCLKSIEKELVSNSFFNNSLVVNRLPRKLEGLALAKKFCENNIVLRDTLEFINKVTFGGVFSGGHDFGDRNAYDELINTGNLQLIETDSIRNAIADLYGYADAVSKRIKIHASRFSSYTSELRPFDSEKPAFVSKFDRDEMMNAFRTEEFRKVVDLEISYTYKVRDYIGNLEEQTARTIKLIQNELDNEL